MSESKHTQGAENDNSSNPQCAQRKLLKPPASLAARRVATASPSPSVIRLTRPEEEHGTVGMSAKSTHKGAVDSAARPSAEAVTPLNGAEAARARVENVWHQLDQAGDALKSRRLDSLFETDQARFETFSASFDDILLDYSKEKIDLSARALLFDLAREAHVAERRDAMFTGEIVNGTERRAARHNILRSSTPPLAGVEEMREQFLEFAQAIRTGERLGATGKQFTDIVNIGIGGSYLGPRLAVDALKPFADGPRIHFVSNVDPWNFHAVVDGLDPARTLFLCCSKSFGTQETQINLDMAMDWVKTRLGPNAIKDHFCAITARPEAARQYGIAPDHIFQIWDWAGGRFSIWSSMGLCVAIRVGRRNFEEFLAGGEEMDEHFRSAPLEHNLPVILALVGIWRRNIEGRSTYVISPYEQRLEAFPEYIQQLEMESNGKRVRRDGTPMTRETSPFVFGGAGTNTQHSFFQKLHQGTDAAPVDFLVGAETITPGVHAQQVLTAHCLAQSKALMRGLDSEAATGQLGAKGLDENRVSELASHVVCPGDRPSTTLLYRRLDPRTLGRLIALYEHKIFTQAAIWDIECFDQWGVELGKKLADDLLDRLNDEAEWEGEDASTRGLLAWRRKLLADQGE